LAACVGAPAVLWIFFSTLLVGIVDIKRVRSTKEKPLQRKIEDAHSMAPSPTGFCRTWDLKGGRMMRSIQSGSDFLLSSTVVILCSLLVWAYNTCDDMGCTNVGVVLDAALYQKGGV